MSQPLLPYRVLASLTADGRLLFGTRCLRMFAYGMLSVILVMYLTELGFKDRWGTIVSAALLGDIAVSLWITTSYSSKPARVVGKPWVGCSTG